MAYKHGTYGYVTDSSVKAAVQSATNVGYIGISPVNLVRGYSNYVNKPIKVSNMAEAQTMLGYSSNWTKFTLCEAMSEHFEVKNIGPIFCVNVLDPSVHKKESTTSKTLSFVSGTARFKSDTIILDTFAAADKVENVDYSLSYNSATGDVVVKLLKNTTTKTLAVTFYEIDTTQITASTIIGAKTTNGEYTGLKAFELMYQKYNAVLNILAAPGWSEIPSVYEAMCATATKLNGHWDAFVVADIPLKDSDDELVDTIEKAIEWKSENSYSMENSKVCFPCVKDGSGRVFHLSTLTVATMLEVDTDNNDVPFETPSNKQVSVACQYFGATSPNQGFDQVTANNLNEQGITTVCFWAGRWVIWGPHTSAYIFNGGGDVRATFDVNLRMLYYITNQFQLDYGTEIDSPMDLNRVESILANERAKLSNLVGMGALIGEPTVEFISTENPTSNMMNGDFVWNISVTNTPPFKSGTAKITYTDEGFQALAEESSAE